MIELHGRCLCQAIRFTIPTPRIFDVCHCEDCRRWHGGPAIGIDGTDVTLACEAPSLSWYRGPTGAERGFCSNCGSSLFYRYPHAPLRWSVYIGALADVPQNIPLGNQHFLSQKPTNYQVK